MDVAHLGDPGVLEGLLSRGAALRLVGEQLGDQVLCLVGNVVPAWVREGELPDSHLLHDVLIAGPVEGGHAGQDDVQDDTARPDVALLIVLLVEDLGGYVIGGSKLLIEGLFGVEAQGGTEIDDLDLIEILVLLQKNVLRLKISIFRFKVLKDMISR